MPPGGDSREASEVADIILGQLQKWPNVAKIILGDYNACIDPSLDRVTIRNGTFLRKEQTRPESALVRKLHDDWNWSCPWREQFPFDQGYSYAQSMHNDIRKSRIDYALVSPNARESILEVGYEEDAQIFESDHCCFFLSFLSPIRSIKAGKISKKHHLPLELDWGKYQLRIAQEIEKWSKDTPVSFVEAETLIAKLETTIKNIAEGLRPKPKGAGKQAKTYLPIELQAVKFLRKKRRSANLPDIMPQLVKKYVSISKIFPDNISSLDEIQMLIKALQKTLKERLHAERIERVKGKIAARINNFKGSIKQCLRNILGTRED